MIPALLACAALAGLGAAALAAVALRRARGLRARHLRFAAQALPPLDAEAERLVDAPRALLNGTRFADGQRLLLSSYATPCVADLACTAEAIFLRREQGGPDGGKTLAIPLAWVEEAVLHRALAQLAGRELPMLRLRWKRGGEELETEISLRGGMAQLERLRREVHLRQGRGDMLAQLRKYVEAGPAGSPAGAAGGDER
ncbi:MAG: hypothetical protein NVSMB23_25770 [Myxococcales bacterium]